MTTSGVCLVWSNSPQSTLPILWFCPEPLLTAEGHSAHNISYYLVPVAFSGFEW